ncbi:hypothetical protein KO506_12710 [Polaribacter vadi]|uniref:hypothetical protein n=1 Tax=Polaribacter TaxID=52959 RepID=UPI001C097708|nr:MULTISPECIES: hypothetical protein [Polaribacter]MBU3012270.1 hypothetical protein [Polaribacter vadi]MDO6742087.1 hypothetical protein [Polaribacter sp. 1_MG-2023]
METNTYKCEYCKKKYVPKRRRVQKFCSNSCRVSFHRLKNLGEVKKTTELQTKKKEQENSKVKIDEISVSGVANSAIGSGIVEIAKNIFTPEENKPATKGDILKLASNLKRYHQIKNLPPNAMGHIPHFDLHTNNVIYLDITLTF